MGGPPPHPVVRGPAPFLGARPRGQASTRVRARAGQIRGKWGAATWRPLSPVCLALRAAAPRTTRQRLEIRVECLEIHANCPKIHVKIFLLFYSPQLRTDSLGIHADCPETRT